MEDSRPVGGEEIGEEMPPEPIEEITPDPVGEEVPSEPIDQTPVAVRVISRQGAAVLVERVTADGDLARYQVPKEVISQPPIDSATVPAGELDQAIPYGLPWELMLTITFTAEDVARELRKAGIWTKDDLLRGGEVLSRAILRAAGKDIRRFIGSHL